MSLFFFLTGFVQCLLVWFMGQTGLTLQKKARQEEELARTMPPAAWPTVALIVPVAGLKPMTAAALRSLADQSYPDFRICLVTEAKNDPAAPLINSLVAEYANIVHVVAGPAKKCGQKNHNLLSGLVKMAPTADVFAFCDSTHLARPDFLRCLVEPIARGEAAFATGYHEVVAKDNSIPTLGYALSVLFMRLLQGMNSLTQPWGGAMAMRKSAFARYEIAALWETNVVDDCSLAAWLRKKGVTVRLAPGALLTTVAGKHSLAVWHAWLVRQIMFLKFCIPGQWASLGFLCFIMAAPPIWAAVAVLGGILNMTQATAPFLALCWFCFIAWAVNGLRRLAPERPTAAPWLSAFFCAACMFALVYLHTLFQTKITWNNVRYTVDWGGVVLAEKRLDRL